MSTKKINSAHCVSTTQQENGKIFYKYHNSTAFVDLIDDNAMVMSKYNHVKDSCESQVIRILQRDFPDDYLLCVGYSVNPKDVQIAMSGTRRSRERMIDAAYRELQEETFLYSESLQQIIIRNRKATCFVGDITQCRMEKVRDEDENDDVPGSKVHVYIHGTLEDFKKVFSKAFPCESYSDNIDRIVLIPLSRFTYSETTFLSVKDIKFIPISQEEKDKYEIAKQKQQAYEATLVPDQNNLVQLFEEITL